MQAPLNRQQLHYVLHHLGHHLCGWDKVSGFIFYGDNCISINKSINFISSHKPYIEDDVMLVDDIPVLFPCSENARFYTLTEEGNLQFHHDILKSAFFILSGYHEWDNPELIDAYGRYDYNGSVQKELNIIDKPLVNYYFDVIIDGLEAFARFHSLELRRRHPFSGPVLLMTHDVDRINFFKIKSVLSRWLDVFVKGDSQYCFIDRLRFAWHSSLRYFAPLAHPENLYYSFPFLIQTQKKHKIRSTWFMLNKRRGEPAGDYTFNRKPIQQLVKYLLNNNCEVGLHGSFWSSKSVENYHDEVSQYIKYFSIEPNGARQHYLVGTLPELFRFQSSAGLVYDSTMGFSAREGFRHGYCHPYHPFDHDNQMMLPLWELPLLAMDTTLFEKRGLENQRILESLDQLLSECRRFNGVFTFLWHNCRNNQRVSPGINLFYDELCSFIMQRVDSSLTCKEAIDIFEQQINS